MVTGAAFGTRRTMETYSPRPRANARNARAARYPPSVRPRRRPFHADNLRGPVSPRPSWSNRCFRRPYSKRRSIFGKLRLILGFLFAHGGDDFFGALDMNCSLPNWRSRFAICFSSPSFSFKPRLIHRDIEFHSRMALAATRCSAHCSRAQRMRSPLRSRISGLRILHPRLAPDCGLTLSRPDASAKSRFLFHSKPHFRLGEDRGLLDTWPAQSICRRSPAAATVPR